MVTFEILLIVNEDNFYKQMHADNKYQRSELP